jgi:hypothetical protein
MKFVRPIVLLGTIALTAVYVVFQKGEERRKFSTKNNEFNLPDEVLEELGLKEAQ